MVRPEVAHLRILAEVDSLLEQLTRWAESAPAWEPARTCRAMVRRLVERASSLRVRLEAPLVVATLGGSGTGKSALVNALVGAEIVQTGRGRPTTTWPTLVCRPGISPEMLGIDPKSVHLVQRELPALSGLVLVDCPDTDTAEAPDEGTGLARLRGILPHCDVLLVTTTQQKYRSARVGDELLAAASGARLVFVQTHAEMDEDIRDDWRAGLSSHYATGRLFFVDSLKALADVQSGMEPRGEFAALVDLLTRQLAGTAAARIRRANLLDLVDETLRVCSGQIETGMAGVEDLEAAIDKQRAQLAAELTVQMRAELLASRRQWEGRLLGQVASRWGLSPFSLVLRVYQGLGSLLAGGLLLRARTPAQMALWGTVQGAQVWRRRQQKREAEAGPQRAVATCWSPSELRSAAVILDGYASQIGLDSPGAKPQTVAAEAAEAAEAFIQDASVELESLIGRLAVRHTGWFTRWRYELALCAMLGVILYRLGKNFFYDSWWAPNPAPVFGLDFYLSAGFWMLLWCALLLWAFSARLRRGLRRQINQLTQPWASPRSAVGVFAQLEADCLTIKRFRQEQSRLAEHVAHLRTRVAAPDAQLGHRASQVNSSV